MSAAPGSYWVSLATAYRALGPPLCPSPEDLDFFQTAVQDWVRRNGPARIALLGATAKLAELPLPHGSSLLAFDHSMPMVKCVWPGDVLGIRAITCADWRMFPLSDASVDLILADGSLSCVRYPCDLEAVAASTRRILSPNGRFLVRCYLPPRVPQSAEALFEAIYHNPLPSFHYFKLQLLIALQTDPAMGSRVADAYLAWRDHAVDIDRLAACTGWQREAVEMIRLYCDSSTVYAFPTQAEIVGALEPHFKQVDAFVPDVPMGSQTPILVFAPNS